MKKFLTTLMVLAAMVSVASAGVGIQWTTAWGGYTHDAPNIVDDPSSFAILDHYSVIWQLIYAGADNTAQAPDLSNAANGYVGIAGVPANQDVVWAERTIAAAGATAPEDGSVWNNFMYRVGTDGDTTFVNTAWNTAGFVYQRVFEGMPADGSYWYDSPLFAYDETWTDSLSPEGFNPEVDPGNAGFQPNNRFPPAVPEPATMSLLGLGALVMAFRRRRS